MSKPLTRGATSRRALLAGAVCGWALASLPGLRPGNALVTRIRHVLAAGTRAEPDVLILAREIVYGLLGTVTPIERLEDSQILARIRSNIAADYRAGRLADIHGWRVSFTESRALALMRAARHV
jgi:hypothetical protein